MLIGKVRWFSNIHGYGFIDHEGKDVFVHYSVIKHRGYRSLEDGQEVAYEVASGPKGEHATLVYPETAEVGEAYSL